MSQQEFENYLMLLTRLLRISPRQRERVADEFRAHMEDRLDELVAGGISRDKAIQQALEEFGDAAALASEFVSISSGKRRRWIMRLTTASVAAMVLIAAGIFTFWPGTTAGPGAAAVVAQNPGGGGQPGGLPLGIERAAQATTLDDKLNQRIDAEWVETPFHDVISHLQDQTGITFYIKHKKIEEAGVANDTPVTQNFKQIRLSTLLDLMLEELGLVYSQKDDLIVITTPDDASATMEVRVYDCRDLLAMPTALPGSGMPGRPGAVPGSPQGAAPNFGDPFAAPAGGDPFGAPAGAAPFAPREALPGGDSSIPPAAPGRSPSGATNPRNPMPRTVPATTPGDEVLPQVGPGGDAYGGGPGGPGGMMGGLGGSLGGGGFGGERGPQRPLSTEDLKAEQLMDIVITAVEPDSWSDMGGPGTIGQYNGLLVVSQSARTHTKVEKVLDMLRDAAGLPRSKQSRVVK